MADRKALLVRFSELEAQRNALLRTLAGETHERLAQQPRPGAWSVAQVVLHLAIAEEGIMNYIDKKRSLGGHRPVGVFAPIRLALLNSALALPMKFKAPAVVATVPPCSFAEACQRWQDVRERMQHCFATIPEELIGHGLIKHPSAGKFDLVQGQRFVRWHVRHHGPQIRRTLRLLT